MILFVNKSLTTQNEDKPGNKYCVLRLRGTKTKKLKNTFIHSMLIIAIFILSSFNAFAASGHYESTYYMRAGLFSKEFKASRSLDITIDPSVGHPDFEIFTMVDMYSWYGWHSASLPMYSVNSVTGGTVHYKLTGAGTYRVYFRHYYNNYFRGCLYFSYS